MTSPLRPHPEPSNAQYTEVVAGRAALTIEDVVRLARGQVRVSLDPDPDYRERLRAAQKWVVEHQSAETEIYGVTTGVGASVENQIPESLRAELPLNLLRFHGVGTGRILSEEEAAATVAARLASLTRGHSGVSEALLERLCVMLEARLLPRIPAEGSVGASGDLTPLSYVASTLVGEREVTLKGELMSAAEALTRLDLEPLTLRPKESLAVMNGTSMMTGLACLAHARASALGRLASTITAMTSEAIHGNPEHFDPRLAALKPHPGQITSAGQINAHLSDGPERPVARLQDRYSVRCAPHVIGVLLDALDFGRSMLEIELNGVNDNPIVDPEAGQILHGGNFYGGHVCFVMDSLKNTIANIADLLDRQLTLLCCRETSDGLPDNLVAGEGIERVVHHGFKAMQISASALTAEALKLTMPASVFSRSTESHNQDKVSMGAIAARDCLRVLELSETVGAILMLAVCQAVDLRGDTTASRRSLAIHRRVREEIEMVSQDRRQDLDIARVLALHHAGELDPEPMWD